MTSALEGMTWEFPIDLVGAHLASLWPALVGIIALIVGVYLAIFILGNLFDMIVNLIERLTGKHHND